MCGVQADGIFSTFLLLSQFSVICPQVDTKTPKAINNIYVVLVMSNAHLGPGSEL